MSRVKIVPIPVLSDNYAYLIIDPSSREAGIVDPSETEPVAEAVRKEKVNLTSILTTHHHWDHVDGIMKLINQIPSLRVIGHKKDKTRTPGINHLVEDGDTFSIGQISIKVIFIPCHTSGHVAYYLKDEKAVFTGDTLFIAGCGRLFEGTAGDMYQNMVKLMALPDETRVFCGHEYTEKNLQFSLTLEPRNRKVQEKLKWAKERRSQNLPTVPSVISEEKEINPFVRVNNPELQKNINKKFPGVSTQPVSIFEKVRSLKDSF